MKVCAALSSPRRNDGLARFLPAKVAQFAAIALRLNALTTVFMRTASLFRYPLWGALACALCAQVAYAQAVQAQTAHARTSPNGSGPDGREIDSRAAPQTSGSAGRQVFLPADFARFVPRNALDMIEQVPGFAIDDGGDARGLGQASGNLLINGDRITSKSTSISDRLSRIPAENVVRIEIVDGATLDIPGLTGRVANIIAKTGALSGQFLWRPRYTTIGTLGLREGEISIAGSAGPVDYVVAFENDQSLFETVGPNIFSFANGMVDNRTIRTSREDDQPEINATFDIAIAPQVELTLNTAGFVSDFDSFENDVSDPGGALPPVAEFTQALDDDWGYELGGDLTFPVGPGRLKLIVLEAYESADFFTQQRLTEGDLPEVGTRFDRLTQTGERIARAEYSWPLWGADWQISGEAAFNRLDQESRLFQLDADNDEFVEVPFPSGQGGVREDRYEALLSYGRRLTQRLSLQVIAGGEYSQIAQTGAAALSRSFQRPKGSVGLAWVVSDGLDINVELARRVGQLNFGDFLADVDLAGDAQDAGNSSLRPQQSWEMEIEFAKKLGPWGQTTIELFHREISDFVAIVPLANGGQSAGNIDTARQTGMALDATLNFAPVGVSGAQLDINLEIRDSNLIDPVTNTGRRFDDEDPILLNANFRHDIPDTDWAYGGQVRAFTPRPSFRVSELITANGANPRIELFIEHKDVLGMTFNLEVDNLTNGGLDRRRTVFAGPRGDSPVLLTEDRQRFFGRSIRLSVSGSF